MKMHQRVVVSISLLLSLLIGLPALSASSCDAVVSKKRLRLPAPITWSEETLASAVAGQEFFYDSPKGYLGPVSIKRLDEFSGREQMVMRKLQLAATETEAVNRARSRQAAALFALIRPAYPELSDLKLKGVVDESFTAIEVGTWVAELKNGGLIQSAIFSDGLTDSISAEKPLINFLFENHLAPVDVRKLAFFHTHPGRHLATAVISASDISEIDALAAKFKTTGLQIELRVYAVAADPRLDTASVYSALK